MGPINGWSSLFYVRLLVLLGVVLTAFVFHRLVNEKLIEDPVESSLVAAVFAINPAFGIMVHWATIGMDAFGALLGLLAAGTLLGGPLCGRTAREQRTVPVTARVARILIAALLLLLAMCIYQPGAMFFWTGIFIWLLGKFRGDLEDWIRLAAIGTFFIVVIGCYVLGISHFADADSRVHISLSVIRRIGFFIFHPLRTTLAYPIYQPTGVAWSICALYVLTFGCRSFIRQEGRPPELGLLLLGLSPLLVLPTVAAVGGYDVSRTRGAAYGLIILLWFIALRAGLEALGKERWMRPVLAGTLVLLCLSSAYLFQRYLVSPQIREEAVVSDRLQDYVRENRHLNRVIAVRPATKEQWVTGMRGEDELGIVSSSQPWVPTALVQQLLAENLNRPYRDTRQVQVIQLLKGDPVPPGDFLIDLSTTHKPR